MDDNKKAHAGVRGVPAAPGPFLCLQNSQLRHATVSSWEHWPVSRDVQTTFLELDLPFFNEIMLIMGGGLWHVWKHKCSTGFTRQAWTAQILRVPTRGLAPSDSCEVTSELSEYPAQ